MSYCHRPIDTVKRQTASRCSQLIFHQYELLFTFHRIIVVVSIQMDPKEMECRGVELIQIGTALGDGTL